MCGVGLDEKNVFHMEPMCKAIMANPTLVNDPYVRAKVSKMIQKRIKTAKIGVLDVEGDYAIIGNDPYSLLQNIFGMKITGLLKAGECYHKHWLDKNVSEIIAFRAPMTSHENVCKLNVVCNEDMQKWYKYIKTCCILNSWDTTAIRCNGADYDSDSFFTTNNNVLLESFVYKTTLMCVQESTPKKIPTEADYIASDINGFGDSIGSVTNKATNMISLRDQFDEDSINELYFEELHCSINDSNSRTIYLVTLIYLYYLSSRETMLEGKDLQKCAQNILNQNHNTNAFFFYHINVLDSK